MHYQSESVPGRQLELPDKCRPIHFVVDAPKNIRDAIDSKNIAEFWRFEIIIALTRLLALRSGHVPQMCLNDFHHRSPGTTMMRRKWCSVMPLSGIHDQILNDLVILPWLCCLALLSHSTYEVRTSVTMHVFNATTSRIDESLQDGQKWIRIKTAHKLQMHCLVSTEEDCNPTLHRSIAREPKRNWTSIVRTRIFESRSSIQSSCREICHKLVLHLLAIASASNAPLNKSAQK